MKIAEHLTKPISKILKFLLRRLVFVTVAIILQMIWMTYMVVVIGEYSKAIEWVFRIFSITVVIYIANKDDNPAYKLAWTIPILLFPIFGGFLYLVLGDKQPAKKLRMELEQSIEDTEFLLGQDYGVMERLEQEDYQGVAVVNYTDSETPFTRIIEHKHFENSRADKTVITREYPAVWEKDKEPYYPVNNSRNQKLYKMYTEIAAKESNTIFGGRLAEYKYYDMDKVIEAAFRLADKEFACQ